MLGDNRDHSKDSRYWGTVRLAEIKGPAFLLYWSWDFSGGWLELLQPRHLVGRGRALGPDRAARFTRRTQSQPDANAVSPI